MVKIFYRKLFYSNKTTYFRYKNNKTYFKELKRRERRILLFNVFRTGSDKSKVLDLSQQQAVRSLLDSRDTSAALDMEKEDRMKRKLILT